MAQPIVALAGATGDLGTRIAKALIARGATVRALVRKDVSDKDSEQLKALGVTLAKADANDVTSMAAACEGGSVRRLGAERPSRRHSRPAERAA